jgi:hypothetical protein
LKGRRLPYAGTTIASLIGRFTGREREDTLSIMAQTKGASRSDCPPRTRNVVVLQTETSQGTAVWVREDSNGMSAKQKVTAYILPHEMNKVDVRERSAFNVAIDADKRYPVVLFTQSDDVPADIQVD